MSKVSNFFLSTFDAELLTWSQMTWNSHLGKCQSSLISSPFLPVQDHSESPLRDPGGVVRLVSEYRQTHKWHLDRGGENKVLARQQKFLLPCGKLTPSLRSFRSDL